MFRRLQNYQVKKWHFILLLVGACVSALFQWGIQQVPHHLSFFHSIGYYFTHINVFFIVFIGGLIGGISTLLLAVLISFVTIIAIIDSESKWKWLLFFVLVLALIMFCYALYELAVSFGIFLILVIVGFFLMYLVKQLLIEQ